jgi:hypothetical protein
MKTTTIVLWAYLFVSTANAAIVTIEHNITNLPSSGYVPIDLDDDGFADINLASNFYISTWNTWSATEFTRSYALIGDVIDANLPWSGGSRIITCIYPYGIHQ